MKKNAKHKKELKKTLGFYKLHYGFKPPYNVIADAEFLVACSDAGIDPRRELLLELDDKLTPIVTPEILRELRERKEWSAVDHAKTFFYLKEKQKEGAAPRENVALIAEEHWQERDLSPAALSVKWRLGATNEPRYMVATNDKLLRRDLGNIPGVPVLHVDSERKKVLLIPAGTVSKLQAKKEDSSRLTREKTREDKEFSKTLPEEEEVPKVAVNKKRKPQGPNSLSCRGKLRRTEIR